MKTFGVTTPNIHYFFNTEYDAVLFAKNRSKKLKSAVIVFEDNVSNPLYRYQGGNVVKAFRK